MGTRRSERLAVLDSHTYSGWTIQRGVRMHDRKSSLQNQQKYNIYAKKDTKKKRKREKSSKKCMTQKDKKKKIHAKHYTPVRKYLRGKNTCCTKWCGCILVMYTLYLYKAPSYSDSDYSDID